MRTLLYTAIGIITLGITGCLSNHSGEPQTGITKPITCTMVNGQATNCQSTD